MKVLALYIARAAGDPMRFMNEVRAIAGLGLEHDRYALHRGSWKAKGETEHKKKRNVTIIALEDIRASNLLLPNQNRYAAAETRRNIVTEGLRVMELVGHEFTIGSVRMRAIEPSDPCNRPDALCGKKGFEKAFAGRAGINAEILSSGIIILNEQITVP